MVVEVLPSFLYSSIFYLIIATGMQNLPFYSCFKVLKHIPTFTANQLENAPLYHPCGSLLIRLLKFESLCIYDLIFLLFFKFICFVQCRRSWFKSDRCRHGHIYRTRLEPHEGPAGHGQSSQDRAEEGGERIQTHHQEYSRGEDYVLAEI